MPFDWSEKQMSHIPVVHESILQNQKPDYIIIFPWNISKEIIEHLNFTKSWGAKFLIAIPQLTLIESE